MDGTRGGTHTSMHLSDRLEVGGMAGFEWDWLSSLCVRALPATDAIGDTLYAGVPCILFMLIIILCPSV